jgi:beta-lactamase superfamily II metal-dependent hydrolase
VANVAKDVLWPTDSNILIRVVFLYVGQGDSTIVMIKDGATYKTILVDINKDKEGNGGINVPRLMKDLLKDQGGKLDVFVNTHPHNDHLDDITELSNSVDIREVWHSGHVPGNDHRESYDELMAVKKKHGNDAETELLGSRSSSQIGEAEYYVLAPAKHVTDDISDETEEGRYRRIHEQCAVLKFGKGDTWVMLTGDADRDAWEKHITDYHEERLAAQVLSAAHHGSRTFFRYDKKDDPYLVALQKIAPDYVIISAPKSSESPHNHPHDDAVGFYEDEVGADNVLHSGENRESYICDIFTNGTYEIWSDTKLTDEYGHDDDEDVKSEQDKGAAIRIGAPTIVTATKIDRRPMG